MVQNPSVLLMNSKASVFCSVDINFLCLGFEPYIKLCSHKTSKAIARLRMSSHGLNIEAGRYGAKYQSKHNRCCPTCTDLETLELIISAHFFHREGHLVIFLFCVPPRIPILLLSKRLYRCVPWELELFLLRKCMSGNAIRVVFVMMNKS